MAIEEQLAGLRPPTDLSTGVGLPSTGQLSTGLPSTGLPSAGQLSTGTGRAAKPWGRIAAELLLLAGPLALCGFALSRFAPVLPDGFDEATAIVRAGYTPGDVVVCTGMPPQDVIRRLAGLAVLSLGQHPHPPYGPPFSRVWLLDGRSPAAAQAPIVGLPPHSGDWRFGQIKVSIHPLAPPTPKPTTTPAPRPSPPAPAQSAKGAGGPAGEPRLFKPAGGPRSRTLLLRPLPHLLRGRTMPSGLPALATPPALSTPPTPQAPRP